MDKKNIKIILKEVAIRVNQENNNRARVKNLPNLTTIFRPAGSSFLSSEPLPWTIFGHTTERTRVGHKSLLPNKNH